MTKKFLDPDHPYLKPLWVRVLLVGSAAAWGVFELATGSPLWSVVFLGLAGYAAWVLFLGGGREG